MTETHSTIHVLIAGFPLCGFSLVPPVNWPPMHTWIREDQVDVVRKENPASFCRRCNEEVDR